MTTKEKVNFIADTLKNIYPETSCFLHYSQDHELLFAIMLSAQTTDKKVNSVTEVLYKKYPDIPSFANAEQKELQQLLFPLGLSATKASNLIKTANILHNIFQDIIPTDREELIKLPGVGYKTATVYLAEKMNYPSIPVDTHIKRLAKRLKLFKGIEDPTDISKQFDKYYQGNDHIGFHRRMILFGRNICFSRSPLCQNCPFLNNLCPGEKK